MMNYMIGLFFVTLILLWMTIVLISMERKKQKMEYETLKETIKRNTSLFSERAAQAGFALKEANYLNAQVKREFREIKETNQFMNQAMKEKVNKKKIRGKRRRKTA